MRLRHFHLPSLTPYSKSATIQERLIRKHLDFKALVSSPLNPTSGRPPPPYLLTFECQSTYTTGRRDLESLTPSQEAHLRADGAVELIRSLRGGQTTFHGPGQVVAYPILDLKAHDLSVRAYIALLEDTIVRVCGRHGVKAFPRCQFPGAWINDDEKIASVGVHLRRNVSSHGLSLNVSTDLKWFDRIVMCGLEGKRATSLHKCGAGETTVPGVAAEIARQLADSLPSVDGVETMESEEDLLR